MLGAQPFFLLLPTAPPRKLDHLVDTIAEVSGIDLDSGFVAKLYHPLAAMPSIHMTIAVVTAEGIGRRHEIPPSVRLRAPIRRSWPASSLRPQTTTCSTSSSGMGSARRRSPPRSG